MIEGRIVKEVYSVKQRKPFLEAVHSLLLSPGLAVGLVVRGADVGADGVVAALPDDRSVTHVHRLVEGLQEVAGGK